ncbi:hypothetical protein [Pseudoalteromonas sp. TB64]|uniref:hypothetical protein n=1 Tax=Pseudoalteromonas sp. TB64 TaxID=1938600 RepID=UPI0003FAF5D7|nr:hypothetical protein [Pseudoalteromonas sp. TB64]
MKVLSTIFLYLFFTVNVNASESIILAKTYQLKSSILNEQRNYSVYLPLSYSENPN